jgi:hypothetical protein
MVFRDQIRRPNGPAATVVGILDTTSIDQDEGSVLRWLGLGVTQVAFTVIFSVK